jgi:hypothetical protein
MVLKVQSSRFKVQGSNKSGNGTDFWFFFVTRSPGSLKRPSSHLVKEAGYLILPEN